MEEKREISNFGKLKILVYLLILLIGLIGGKGLGKLKANKEIKRLNKEIQTLQKNLEICPKIKL